MRPASRNSVVATLAVGIPCSSKYAVSCELHDIQDPQLLVPSTIASHASINSFRTSASAVRAGLGFARRRNCATPYLLLKTSSTRSRKTLPLGNPISRIPTVLPPSLSRRLAIGFGGASLSKPTGSRMSSAIVLLLRFNFWYSLNHFTRLI